MDKSLLALLVCPVCKSPLIYQKASSELICKIDRLGFPIVDDIPMMLTDKARIVPHEEIDQLKA